MARFTKEDAKGLSILSVAENLGMNLRRQNSWVYEWEEHDSFKIDTRKNTFFWYSRDFGGDTIKLVETIKEVSFKEAMYFLREGEFPSHEVTEFKKEPFQYRLPEEDFTKARAYLRDARGLSDETIDFFCSQGKLVQAQKKTGDYPEPVIVFKFRDHRGKMTGASLQGIEENKEIHSRGRLKQIMYNSDGLSGFTADIGTPKRLVVAEAPIDLMSYYELHKDKLSDVRLIAMDGLKESTISHYVMELLYEIEGKPIPTNLKRSKVESFWSTLTNTSTYFDNPENQNLVTLAVDNDEAGQRFVERLKDKGYHFQTDLPPLLEGQSKMDWNDYLKQSKQERNREVQEDMEEYRTEERTAPIFDAEVLDGYVEEVMQHYTEDINTAEYLFPDGRMVSSWEYGSRGDDHRSIRNYFDVMERSELDILDEHPQDFWNLVHNGIGAVRLAPETQVALVLEGQELTPIQQEILKNSSFTLEVYQESKEITPAYLQSLGIEDMSVSTQSNIKKALEKSQGQMNNRASGGEGYSQPDAAGSAEPEAEISATFEQTVTSHPTSPYRYLHFSTNFEEVQRRQSKYHPITQDDLKRMNQYAGSIQKSSQWYLEELANSKIYYFYSNNGEVNLLDVNFKQENFLHLTGIRPVVSGKNAGDFVVDFAEGRGDYNQILVSNSLKEKLQVIPMLEDILDSKSFVLDNLDEVRIAQRLNFSEAIKSKDEDFLLLFKDIGEERVPASLMKIKRDLKVDVEKTKEKTILGVFRERDGQIEQLSINEDYIKDGGKELQAIMENGLFEEIQPVTAKDFTAVLAAAYNVGLPRNIGTEHLVPEEYKMAWEEFYKRYDKAEGNLDQVVREAETDGLLDVESDFLKDFTSDDIYKNHYHVRLQWAENHENGPTLPFSDKELIDYETFARELYKQNNLYYDSHHDSVRDRMNKVEGSVYIPYTKVKFDLYAPDGELIRDGLRYDIADEVDPIAHKERLRSRDMREHPELMKLDGELFKQYHLERMASVLDISQLSYALEDVPYADQLLSQLPYGELENSPIGFTESSHEDRLGFISFDGMDSVEIENLSAWFEKSGVADSPQEQVALVEQWQREIETLSEKVEQTIAKVRDEHEKAQSKTPQEIVKEFIEKNDTKALSQTMEEGMRAYLNSDQYKKFLDTISQFHQYSPRNIQLMKMQNPDMTRAASFHDWKKFGRHVIKGEKGLKIWHPYTVTIKEKNEEGVEETRTIQRFKLKAGAFDISQTDGKDLPKPLHELNGDVKDYDNLYRAARAVSLDNNVPIEFDTINRFDTKGYYSPSENKIVISDRLQGQEQILKTVFHEMAHSELHRGTNAQFGDEVYAKQELQAEGIAYVVAAHYGFDTSQYSFGYLASWSQDKEGFKDMMDQLDIVQQGAKKLINKMDQKLSLIKEKQLTTDKFQSKLNGAINRSHQLSQKQEGKEKGDVEKKQPEPRPL